LLLDSLFRGFHAMKVLFFFFLTVFMVEIAGAEEGIKQVTVNNYLPQAAAQAEKEGRKANKLINESSPYLLQHAYNPVNWYAWGDAAFDKAKKENRPIFLSIGYSTCHWCHVMAHESFENKEIAEILNKYFICIKVDREQRPDIDSVYMSATQLINGSGGWPMSVFLDNKLRPFHAATYYPPFSSGNRTGFKDILLKIQDLWVNQPELINQVATKVTARIIAHADDTAESAVLDTNITDRALRHIADSYDEDDGGFSAAPKFPRPGIFALLNQLVLNETKDRSIKVEISVAQKMMETTLDAMASGGIYDQVGGGFHRYSVDENWQVPHFEKMLYSQALMVMAYSDFYQVETKDRYKQIVFQTLNFARQEMQSPGGGFYSALDADSERFDEPGVHAEGAYYLWHEAELKEVLSLAEFEFLQDYFQIRKNGNIHSDPQNEFTRLNIFYIDEEFKHAILTKQQTKLLASARKKLNEKRRQRPRPHLDDKIITAWNGMMLSAFAKASLVFNDPALLAEAKQTAGFIKTHLYNKKSGKLYRQFRAQINTASASTEATLSDYAWLIYGLLDVYEASKNRQWLNWALELQEKQNELFLDQSSGAYFESIADDTSILFRSKSIYDGALPSSNAIALSNLRQFSKLTGTASKKKSLSSQAGKLVSSFATAINDNPSAAAMLLAIEVEQLKE
jgi:uncharacterized protein YyaL (SSP411 family)